jgi:hypothetical protein
MSVLRITLLVGLAIHTTSVLSTAPSGYGIEILSWEVDVFPGQAGQVFNGTVEDVYAQLHQLNPAHSVFARAGPPPVALEARGGGAEEELRKLGGEAERLVKIVAAPIIIGNETSEALETECERWRTEPARCIALFEGVQHLVKVPGKPHNGPGPGNCGRVSCSWGAAMFWCNDVSHPHSSLSVFLTFSLPLFLCIFFVL